MAAYFTDRELDVMQVLWEHGPATVAEVRGRLDENFAYTTVLTVLRTLEAKGHVDHEEAGKAHRYYATVSQEAARRTALSRMVDRIFGGSTELLLTHLVEDRKLSADDIERIRALMKRQIAAGKKR